MPQFFGHNKIFLGSVDTNATIFCCSLTFGRLLEIFFLYYGVKNPYKYRVPHCAWQEKVVGKQSMSKDDGNKDSREFDQKSQYLYNRKFLLLGHKWLLAFVGIGTDPCFFFLEKRKWKIILVFSLSSNEFDISIWSSMNNEHLRKKRKTEVKKVTEDKMT